MVCAPAKAHPLIRRYVWQLGSALDVPAMRAAAAELVGEHDFSSFAVNPKREVESHVRRLHRLDVRQVDGLICFNVVGSSFLYRMVRSLVGFLVHVGSGRAEPGATRRVLAARDRSAAAQSAPGQGLFLAKVFFEPDQWRSYEPALPPFEWSQCASS